MSDLSQLRDHARMMAAASHATDCLVRPTIWQKPVPTCGTPHCMTDSDRVLWTQIADEIDTYLAARQPVEDLFGEMSDEPAVRADG